MRHGVAEDRAESGLDEDRALTVGGRDRALAVAKTLLNEGEAPAFLITSPLVRAVQTAEIVAIGTNLGAQSETVAVRRALSPGGDATTLARRLVSEGRRRVMFVGHEPDLSDLALALVGNLDVRFEKAMVIGLHVPSEGGPSARLRFVLEPKTLRILRS